MASGFIKGPSLGLLPDVPSLMETLSYSYCYVGIMTGECTCLQACLPSVSIPASAALKVGYVDSCTGPWAPPEEDRLLSA